MYLFQVFMPLTDRCCSLVYRLPDMNENAAEGRETQSTNKTYRVEQYDKLAYVRADKRHCWPRRFLQLTRII